MDLRRAIAKGKRCTTIFAALSCPLAWSQENVAADPRQARCAEALQLRGEIAPSLSRGAFSRHLVAFMDAEAMTWDQPRVRMLTLARGVTIPAGWGLHTHAAVVAFQLQQGLVADGEVGPQTRSALKLAQPMQST